MTSASAAHLLSHRHNKAQSSQSNHRPVILGALAVAGLALGGTVVRSGILSQLDFPPSSSAPETPGNSSAQFALSARGTPKIATSSLSELTLPAVAVVNSTDTQEITAKGTTVIEIPVKAATRLVSATELAKQFSEVITDTSVTSADIQWILSALVDHHGMKLADIPSTEQAKSFIKELSKFVRERKDIQAQFGPGKASIRELQAHVDDHYRLNSGRIIQAAQTSGIAYPAQEVVASR